MIEAFFARLWALFLCGVGLHDTIEWQARDSRGAPVRAKLCRVCELLEVEVAKGYEGDAARCPRAVRDQALDATGEPYDRYRRCVLQRGHDGRCM